MPSQPAVALHLSRRLLTALLYATVVYGLGIVAMLVASLIAHEAFFTAIGVRSAPDIHTMIRGMRMIMVLGIVAAPITYRVLARLRAIVDTVRDGDPFVRANAARLHDIAWGVLALELIHLAIGFVAANSATSVQPLDIEWSFSITPWLAVLLFFVLARVFDQGARMRADLEGTV